MLAIQQRPRAMGSKQPSDPNLLFGFSFDGPQEHLFLDPPPEAARGPPLLSDNDSKFLSNFFEDMTSENYNTMSFGEGLNFSEDWLNLPPNLMGTATSFGQEPAVPSASSFGPELHGPASGDFHGLSAPVPPATMMAPPAAPVRPASAEAASADVLAAATLLQNGSLLRQQQSLRSHAQHLADLNGAGPSTLSHMGHLRHQPLEQFQQEERRASQTHPHMDDERDTTFTEMVFGEAPAKRLAPRMNQPVDVQWGSDANFGKHFVPKSDKETSAALLNERLNYMGCLEVSAGNTRPPSPLANGDSSPLRLKTRNPPVYVKEEDDHDAPPLKRRKSKAVGGDFEERDDDASTPSKAFSKRRKSKGEALSTTPPSATESSAKRKKSIASNAAKAARENLSEEQKRENHIKSEQKRRTLIKEGFDDLCDLVPGLKGGGFSKSTMLTMAAEWLEDIMKGNDELKAQLAQLQN